MLQRLRNGIQRVTLKDFYCKTIALLKQPQKNKNRSGAMFGQSLLVRRKLKLPAMLNKTSSKRNGIISLALKNKAS